MDGSGVRSVLGALALIGAATLVWTGAAHLSAQSTEGDPGAHAEAHALMEKVIERIAWYVDNQIDRRPLPLPNETGSAPVPWPMAT